MWPASGHGAGAPISFEAANFLDLDEVVGQLTYSNHELWKVSRFAVSQSLPGHVQIDAVAPQDLHGSGEKAEDHLGELIRKDYAVVITAAAQGTLSRPRSACSMRSASCISTRFVRRRKTVLSTTRRRPRCSPSATPHRRRQCRRRGQDGTETTQIH